VAPAAQGAAAAAGNRRRRRCTATPKPAAAAAAVAAASAASAASTASAVSAASPAQASRTVSPSSSQSAPTFWNSFSVFFIPKISKIKIKMIQRDRLASLSEDASYTLLLTPHSGKFCNYTLKNG